MRRFLQGGEPFVWLSGGALALCLLMIAGLVIVVVVNGVGFFWPTDLVEIELKGGERLLGQEVGREEIPADDEDETTHHLSCLIQALINVRIMTQRLNHCRRRSAS